MSEISSIVRERTERTRWFLGERFGMFIHWGIYAVPARGEWVRSKEHITIEDYQEYYDTFDPTDYNPREWAKAAKAAGMRYAVMTAKHHDGFCLFDSQLTDYKATNTKAGRDLIREFLEAFRAEGLKVGLYYSLIDWHHDQYPAYGDSRHPMRENEAFKGQDRDIRKYASYLHAQIQELLTNYGNLDTLFFDFSYDNLGSEAWQSVKLVEMIRSLQPHILINNRLDFCGHLSFISDIQSRNPTSIAGDFASPEQIIPPEGIVDVDGNSVPWEANLTLNRHWGYDAFDKLYKSPRLVIRKLVECVSKNGNMLLNVGPDAKGRIPDESLAVLKSVGEWMQKNSQSLYGCGSSGLDKPDWGLYTRKGNKLYAHVFEENIGPYTLKGLKGKVKRARFLMDGAEVFLDPSWVNSDDLFMYFGKPIYWFFPLRDDVDTVIELEMEG